MIRLSSGERGAFDNSEMMAMMKRRRQSTIQTFTIIQSLEYADKIKIIQ